MSGKHLGRRVHDLLDGRMTQEQNYAAMAHLGECEDCAARWHELRSAREALNSSSAGIDMRFAQQLLDRERMAHIAKGETPQRARVATGQQRRPAVLALAAMVVMATGVGAAYMAGAPREVSLEFASSTGAATAESVSFMTSHTMRSGDQLRSWVHPDWQETGYVPVEARVVQRPSGANMLVASFLSGMDTMVVTEQHGQLVDALMTEVPRADVEEVTAYVVETEPAQVVWQTGDVVISVACHCELDKVEQVVSTFPTDESPGFADRVATGIGQFTAVLTGN